MTITLPAPLDARVADEVRRGEFRDASDLVAAAVQYYLDSRIDWEDFDRAEVEAKIRVGLEQVEQGKTIDGPEAFRRLRQMAAERRNRES